MSMVYLMVWLWCYSWYSFWFNTLKQPNFTLKDLVLSTLVYPRLAYSIFSRLTSRTCLLIMTLALHITLFVLITINICVLGLGSFSLIHVYKNGRQTVELLLIINLSVIELSMKIFEFIRHVLAFVRQYTRYDSVVTREIQYHIKILLFTGFTPIYYISMTYITINKLLDIALNIRYALYVHEERAKRLVQITWFICPIMAATCSLAHACVGYRFENVFYTYIYPTFDFGFVLVALVTYSFIFHRFKKTRLKPPPSSTRKVGGTTTATRKVGADETPPPTNIRLATRFVRQSIITINVFQNSRFYVSVFLILSFLTFLVIPDIVYLVYGIILNHDSSTLKSAIQIFYEISFLVDGYIYIFMQPNVRDFVRRKLGCYNNGQDNGRSNMIMRIFR